MDNPRPRYRTSMQTIPPDPRVLNIPNDRFRRNIRIPGTGVNSNITNQVKGPGGIAPREPLLNFNTEQAGNIASTIAPFASNIVNSLVKPPHVPAPRLFKRTQFDRVNYGQARQGINDASRRQLRAMLMNLDENTAASVGGAVTAQEHESLSRLNQQEDNDNARIQQQEAMVNAQTDRTNTGMLTEYDQNKVSRTLAIQRQGSQNISNAADKFIGINNETANRKLDEEKFKIIAEMLNREGVASREIEKLKKAGVRWALDFSKG